MVKELLVAGDRAMREYHASLSLMVEADRKVLAHLVSWSDGMDPIAFLARTNELAKPAHRLMRRSIDQREELGEVMLKVYNALVDLSAGPAVDA